MKQFISVLLVLLLLSACAGPKVEEIVETVTDPVLVEVPKEARLHQENGQIYLIQSDQRQPLRLPELTLGTSETYIDSLFSLSDGQVYLSNNQLMARNGSEQLLVPMVDDYKVQQDSLLVKSTSNLFVVRADGTVTKLHTFEGDFPLQDVSYVSGSLALNHVDGTKFHILNLENGDLSVEIAGHVILALENEGAFLYQSPEQPSRLGKLDVATGDTTWYSLGEGRERLLFGPVLQSDNSIIFVFDNASQAEMVFFDLVKQQIQSTDLGLSADFIGFEQTKDGFLVHTKNRIYQSNQSSISYFDFTANDLIHVPEGLLGLSNNNIRVVKNDVYKDYQFPGRIIDAQLQDKYLVVIYTAPTGPMMVLQTIDF